MAVELELYETDDATLAQPFDFGTIDSGGISTIWSLHLWNGNGNALADEAREITLTAYERADTDSGWNQDGEATRDGWIEARLVGQTSGLSEQTTNWFPVGYGRELSIEPITADEARYIEMRIVVPPGASTFQGQVRCTINYQKPARVAPQGLYETDSNGVSSGLGDPDYSELVEGLVGTESGTPDTNVNFTAGIWINAGEMYVKLAHAVSLDGNDGDGFALASGEAYWATISAGPSSTLTVTKSSKDTAPLATSARKAVPTGEVLVGYIHRDFDAAITDSDIYQEDLIYGRFQLETTLLAATVHSGIAVVDNRMIRIDGTTGLTLSASSTNTIWLNPDGSFEVTTGSGAPSQSRAEVLWEVVTDGTGETSRTDLRSYISSKSQLITFILAGTLSTSSVGYAAYQGRRKGRISLPTAIRAFLEDTGGTSGSTIFQIDKRDDAGAWTNLFTSFATDDQRPTIAYNDTTKQDFTALPEVVDIESGSMLRCTVEQIPGTASADGVVTLRVEED